MPPKITGVFINTARANCSIHESGRMVFTCLEQSEDFDIHYFSLDMLDMGALAHERVVKLKAGVEAQLPKLHYDFWVFNWHFVTMAMDLDPQVIAALAGPKFTVVLELAPGDPLQLVPPNVFDAHIALEPGAPRTGSIYPFPRPLDGEARRQTAAPREVPVIGSFGFGTPGKGFDTLVAAANAEFEHAIIRINIPTGDFVGSANAIHGTDYARYLEALCQRIAKPGIEVRFTYDFLDPEGLVDWCAENDLNCFMYSRCQPGLSATTDQAIISGRPLLTSSNDTFRHIHEYIAPYPVTSLREAMATTRPMVEAMQSDWSRQAFNRKFADMLADYGVLPKLAVLPNAKSGNLASHKVLLATGSSGRCGLYDRINRAASALGRTGKYELTVIETARPGALAQALAQTTPDALILADFPEANFGDLAGYSGPLLFLDRTTRLDCPVAGHSERLEPIIPYQTVTAARDPVTTVWLLGHASSPDVLGPMLDRISRELPGSRVRIQAVPGMRPADLGSLQRSLARTSNLEILVDPIPDSGEAAIAAYAEASLILVHADPANSDHLQNLAELAMITERAVGIGKSPGFPDLEDVATFYDDIDLAKLIAMGSAAQIRALARFGEGSTYARLDRALAPQLPERQFVEANDGPVSTVPLRNPAHHELISRLFHEHLGRGPDAHGLQHYLDLLARGRRPARLAKDIAKSEEAVRYRVRRATEPAQVGSVRELLALRGERFIDTCYRELLGRSPDARGLEHHLSLLMDGVSRAEIVAALYRSPEGQIHQSALAGLDRIEHLSRRKLPRWLRRRWKSKQRAESRALAMAESRMRELEQAIADRGESAFMLNELLAKLPPVPADPAAAASWENARPICATLPRQTGGAVFILAEVTGFAELPSTARIVALARSLESAGRAVRLVVWNNNKKQLHIMPREHVGQWPWSAVSSSDFDWYPEHDQPTFVLEPASIGPQDILIVDGPIRTAQSPEVIVETNIIIEARRLGLKDVFLFAGASALASTDASDVERACEDQYMQAMLLARGIVAASETALQQFEAYSRVHQLADSAPVRTVITPPATTQAQSQAWAEYAASLAAGISGLFDCAMFLALHTVEAADRGTPADARIAQALQRLGIVSLPWRATALASTDLRQPWLIVSGTAGADVLAELAASAAAVQTSFAVILPDAATLDQLLGTANGLEILAQADRLVCPDQDVADRLWKAILASRLRFVCAGTRIMTAKASGGDLHAIVSQLIIELAEHRRQAWQTPLPESDGQRLSQLLLKLQRRPKLSLCISTYNRAKWLRTSLANIARQLPEPRDDLEILVVDNTSTDDTPSVAAQFAYRRDFRFIRNSVNVGMLGNLAVTAQRARGEYIWILGDDDLTRNGAVEKVLQVLHNDAALELVYLNYGYTSEPTPDSVSDLDAFLDGYNVLQPPCPDERSNVAALAAKTENFYTAIYSHIYRRDHGLRAYCQDTSGRIFSTMRACIPTTCHVLGEMSTASAYWIGEPALVVNSNVSWAAYGPMLDLEHLPEAWDMAERIGCPTDQVDTRRRNRLWLIEMMWRQLFEADTVGNAQYINPAKVITRLRHLPEFALLVPEFRRVYETARAAGHPAAKMPTSHLFAAGE